MPFRIAHKITDADAIGLVCETIPNTWLDENTPRKTLAVKRKFFFSERHNPKFEPSF